MSPKGTLSLAAALGLVAAFPVGAAASQTAFSTSPVSVSTCGTDTSLRSASPYEVPRPSTSVHYRFTNNAGATAKAVTFDVTFAGQSSRVVDRGTFAPGAGIDRQLDEYANVFENGPVTCRVTAVEFADGTSWHASAGDKIARN